MRKREIEKARLIMPDVVGEAIEDAEKILKEKNIEITEVKKKFDLFTKKDYVIKTEPEVGEEVEDKVVVTISRMKLLPLLLLCVLFAFGGIMFGTGTISRILTTSAPRIESKTHEWTKSGIVVVTKDAKMIDEVKNYEYCVTKRKTTIGCKWEKTETKNVEISKSGVWNVYFRGIDLKGRKSKVSNRDYVRVDNDAPIIEKVKSSIGTNTISLAVDARDEHSGVNTYYYKINDGEYVLGEKEYTISNLEPNKEYKITIKVVDKVGNETEVEINITTLEDANADNNNDGDNNTNNNDNNNNQNDDDNKQEEIIEPPYIDLNEVPSILEYKEDHKLPSNYDFKNSTGTVSCKVGEVEYTNTKDIPIGNHTITCTATNKEGMSTTVSKDVYVKITDAEEEDLNGWIWLNLHYPANSTDWEWKKIDENEELVGDDLLWNEYTGPIRVRIEDIDKIYIRYKLDGNEVIISPDGYYVDIEPERGSIRAGETTKVKINYGTDVDKVEYRINNGVWQEYTEEFEVTANTRIDARIIYHIDVYDEDGNVLLQKPKKKTTTGYVKEIIDSTSGNNSGSGGDGCTDLCSCISGSWGVSMSSTSGYINNGKPVTVTIHYEEGAPIKQYKIGLYGEWRDYTGPITVSWDTYVSAKASGNKEINGCTKWVTGEKTIKIGQRWYGVRVEPDEHSIDSTQTTEVELYTWQRSERISLEYSINGGDYQPYRGVFRVGPNTTIVARASWVLDNGEILTEYGSDTVYENKNGLRTSVNPNTRAVGGLNKAYVGITTNLRAEKIEYTLDNGATWQDYKGTFAVDPNTLVCGRASKTNTDGSIQTSPPDCKWISEDDLGLTIYPSAYAALDGEYVTATIGTRYSVEKIEYSLDNGNTWNEYTGKRIPVKAGNEIKAKAMYKGNTIYSSLPIEILPDSPEILPGPTINESPSNTYTREATISITTKYEARDIYYRINEGAWQKYTEPFKVNKNCKIESYYIRDEDGKTSMTTTFRVTNIRKPNYPYVRIDTDPKNYVNGTEESIKVSLYAEDYKTLEYSLDGIIYKPYTGEITISESTTVYALATNEYGSDEDELPIVTKTPTDPPEKLPVEIVANPDTKDLTDEEGNVKLVNKTEVSLIYGKEVTSACYKLGPSITSAKTREESEAINKTLANTPCVDYTGPFVVDKNTTVYAYVYNAKGFGSDQKMIDFLTLGIANPIISEEPTEATEIAKIKIDYSRNAIVKKYRIDNGPWLEYTDEFEVTANCEIEAINEDMLGNQATSTYKVTNIVKKPRYNLLNKGDYYLIKLNYPKNSIKESREYKWMTDGVWKKYDEHGILLIKPSAASKIITPDGVKIKDDQGNDVIITDHYYILSVDIDKVGENLYMKWDSAKVDAPKIIKSEDTETVTSMDVAISYNKALVTKLYRVIYDDGTDTGWIKYDGKFKVDKKGIVYAKGVDVEGNDSYVSSLRIDNIDSTGPVITVKGDMQTPKQKVTLLVSAKDDGAVDSLLYEEGSKNVNYFKKNGKGLSNPSTVTITENGKYTFYAVDNLGNETIKEIEITNIDKDAPDIEIKVLSTVIGTSTEVEINYGDSVTTEYKIGENGTYQNYTGTFTLSSYDLFELTNEDGSLTIYAKGKDQAGNEREVKEITYVLDLNKFETPNIVTSDGYPMLTSTGMVLGKPTYIEYDSKTTDVENYYRIDGGKWLPYTGGITFVSGHVEAKSIRESTGLEFTSEADVVVPTDAVGEKTYNENLEDYDTIAAGRSKKFTVSPNLVGRKIKIYTGSSVAANSTINVYDKNKKLLTSRPTVAVLTVLEVEEDAYLVEIAAGSSALAVREISLVSEGREIDSSYVPKITIDEANWALSKVATVKYYTEEYKNEYSIDNGTTWNAYVGPIRLEEPTNVIARTVDENAKVFGSSNFIITKIDTFTPEVELNFGNRIQKGYSINLPTYSKIGPSGGSVECKDGDTIVTNTNELEEGKHKITCIVKNNAGNKVKLSKDITIVDVSDYSGESILKILEDNKDMPTGKYTITANGETYPVHVITYEEDQIWKENKVFGDAEDVATASEYAKNMVIVRVEGDLIIDEGVTVRPYYTAYGGPKGFTLYVTGKLENNGTIDNSHGAKAEGQDVYLWKNADETYEYVPAVGGSGGTNNIGDLSNGRAGTSGIGRQTGGGGGGSKYYYTPGAGTAGTSYSGGSGGGGSDLSGASSAAPNGGAGGNSYGRNYGGGGAGNPGGSGDPAGASGTGGLLILYANEYENNGLISAYGYRGGSSSTGPGGSSGGGSINIFTNQATDINQLGIITDTRYNEILGNRSYVGGSAAGTLYRGGAGGTGTLNIGEIRKGQYYDLKEIIEQDKNSYIESVTIKGDSILSILNDNSLKSGYYFFVANDENYPVHLYTYDRSQIWDENKVFGDAEDIGASGKYAQNMVVVKVEGDLTINKGITVRPYYTAYGGPKGFTLYVTGKLENNGTIDNSHGAKAEGQDVYLWKNADETYEYVPAVGGSGGTNNIGDLSNGRAGTSGIGRQTGGGGGGSKYYYTPGAGTAGTSYSGGSGGGGSDLSGASSAAPNGGAGGNSYGRNYGGGGAGNPGGSGDPAGASGTGGLLILYANEYENNGLISAYGYRGGSSSTGPGGSSGGGSINIFYLYQKVKGNTNVLGGSAAGTLYRGGAGGTGTVTYTQLQPVSFALKYTYPDLTKDTFAKESSIVTINYSSTLTKKLYSLDDGNTWLNYKKPFAANPNDKILAKGVNKDDSETEVITYTVPETDGIPYNAYDGTTSEAATLEANKDYIFTVSSEVEGRNLRFFLGSEPSDDASIKVYDKTNKEVLSTTFVDKLTVINIPEGSYKFVINGGSTELTINEINLREEKEIINEIPVIETNDTAWSVNKIIDITYPEGYENEYSLDLGETWIKYEEPITIEKETIIFARTIKDGKVVTTNTYMINKVDAEEPTIELELENEYDYGTDVSIPTKYTVGKSLGTPICKTNDKEITNIKDLEKGTYEITCSITNGAKVTKEVSREVTINYTYTESILNGTDPVLTSGLVPVTIADDGIVTYADISEKWYSYQDKIWANAVILKDETITYNVGSVIPEDNIESYFVWIPRYKYKIFNDGNYSELTSIENKVQTIEVEFENKKTDASSGSTVGEWLTHPAFTSFDSNGMWIGKFETGYDGATSTTGAEVNKVSTNKIIIKPNVYSWRSINVGNAFKNAYDYKRDYDSHMMKNTEWGAVAYLQHSKYGSQASVRINNNANYITGYAGTEEPTLGYSDGVSVEGNRIESATPKIDGTYTINYLNNNSSVASTTGNRSGIYDMSGGAIEYVMGYSTGATTTGGSSDITSLYPNFFTNSAYSKYWDKYTSTTDTSFSDRILGDATGEMGPFTSDTSKYHSSWYGSYGYFTDTTYPWFRRGGAMWDGTEAGMFSFIRYHGNLGNHMGYRIVLTP